MRDKLLLAIPGLLLFVMILGYALKGAFGIHSYTYSIVIVAVVVHSFIFRPRDPDGDA